MRRLNDRPMATYDLSFHAEMRLDAQRNEALRGALSRLDLQGAVVADLGCGTGIWAFEALHQGAKRVYAVDADPHILEVARRAARDLGEEDRVTFICADARFVTFPERVDVFICEMLHTWLVEEQQVPVARHMRQQFPNVCGVPKAVENWLALGYLSTWSGLWVQAPFHMWMDEPLNVQQLSETKRVEKVLLLHDAGAERSHLTDTRVLEDGVSNCLVLSSRAELTDGYWMEETLTTLPKLVFPLPRLEVTAGEMLRVESAYRPGGRWDEMRFRVLSRG